MVIGPPALGPAVETIRLFNSHIIDGRMTVVNDAFGVKFPVFVSIRTVPLPRIIMELISKPNGDSITIEGQFLDPPVIELALPFAQQKAHNLFAPVDELPSDFAKHCQGYRRARPVAGTESKPSSALRTFKMAVSG